MSSPNDDLNGFLKSSVLNEARPMLCKMLDVKLHYPYLLSKYVISKDDMEDIDSERQSKMKVNRFIDILIQRGQKGFDELVKSILLERTQIFIAEKLNKAFEEKFKRAQAIEARSRQPEPSISTDSLRSSLGKSGPIEHCNSPEPTPECPKYGHPKSLSPDRQKSPAIIPYSSSDQNIAPQYRDSVSDLGVDTEQLPKPVMPNRTRETVYNRTGNGCETSDDKVLFLNEASA